MSLSEVSGNQMLSSQRNSRLRYHQQEPFTGEVFKGRNRFIKPWIDCRGWSTSLAENGLCGSTYPAWTHWHDFFSNPPEILPLRRVCTCRVPCLADMVVLGWRLDLMILEVFSNLSDSMVLWFSSSFISSFKSLRI